MSRQLTIVDLLKALLIGGLILISTPWAFGNSAQNNALPSLGDSSSSIISPAQEYRLGRAWLRQLRSQAPIIQDPLVHDYLYNLVYLLASNSDIEQPKIETVAINSAAINAFAVPGGVIGLNAGLMLHARNEDELAGVIAHEIAHLSQRHFARGLEKSQQDSWVGLAALLASVVIAATTGADAGIAALATTQAAAIDSQLRFSRANEQEADRVGMQTLVRAELNPQAMADFFEALQRSMRYSGNNYPEFLLTHPVTESRISDARARADTFPLKPSRNSLEFSLMKIRTQVSFSSDDSAMISDLEKQKMNTDAFLETTEYGLACIYAKANQLEKALTNIDLLLKERPSRITYIATKAEILNNAGRFDEAIGMLKQQLKYNPGNYVLSVHLADGLTRSGKAEDAILILRQQLTLHENWPLLWSMLAEAYGKTNNRLGVHQAKAELYYLYGHTQRAIEQLQYATPLARDQFQATARITERINEMQRSMKDLKI